MKVVVPVLAIALLAIAGQAFARPSAGSAPSAACAPGYRPCLPVKGDLDCGQIRAARKPVRVTGTDPYDLDRDRDGIGCEPSGWGSTGSGSGQFSRWGLIIRRPVRKEAQQVRVGNTVWVFGWSPKAFKGRRFEVCTVGTRRGRCIKPVRRLNGKNQVFSTWTVRRSDTSGGLLRLRIRVNGRGRADDGVRVQ